MEKQYAPDICVVAATAIGNGETEFWAVALPPEQAMVAVANQTGAGWKLAVTGRRLTVKKAAALGMPRQPICRLGPA